MEAPSPVDAKIPKQALTSEQIALIESLPPNFDPQILTDAGCELPLFTYGTLMPENVADSYLGDFYTDYEESSLSGHEMYVHERWTQRYGKEVFPYVKHAGENSDSVQPVKGYAYSLKSSVVDEDGNIETYAERILKIDGYEEVDNGLYERMVVQVTTQSGESIYAMAYINKGIHTRDYELPPEFSAKEKDFRYGPIWRQYPVEESYSSVVKDGNERVHDGDFARHVGV